MSQNFQNNEYHVFKLTIFLKIDKIMGNCTVKFVLLGMNEMNDKTPQQLLIENLDYIKRIINKINTIHYNLTQDEIDDIFQLICEKLLNNGFANFKGKSNIKTYIYKIVHNEMISFVKKETKETLISQTSIYLNNDGENDEEEADNYISAQDLFSQFNIDYVDKIFQKDIIKIIDNTIETFDDKDKLIYNWYFLSKYSQMYIAKLLKLSQPTVNERIGKIKKRIIAAIKKKYTEIEEALL